MARWWGAAEEAHGRPWPPEPVRSARLVEATGPAVVLGSTQAAEVVDVDRAAAAGVAVVRRRSGGGAVLVRPGELVWADVFVPAGDPLWLADVGRATHWLGRTWTDALAALGVRASWHDGPLVSTPWSGLVCFAGLGPGEVQLATGAAGGTGDTGDTGGTGGKVVGVSQRRTRAGALFQCAALLRWHPDDLLDLLSVDDDRRSEAAAELDGAAVGLGVAPTDLEDAFLDRLART